MPASTAYKWRQDDAAATTFTLAERATGGERFRATRSDLGFDSSSRLRAVAQVYAGLEGPARFVKV